MMRTAHGEAVLAILFTCACFATLDTLSKLAGTFVPVTQTLWIRYAVQFVATLAWWFFRVRPVLGASFFRTRHPKFHLLRGALLAGATAVCFLGLLYMPVGELTAVAFTSPMVAMVLAAWLLHEKVSRPQWWLAMLGFAGALIVIRPGSGLFGWAVVFPLALAVTNGAFQVLTPRLARDDEHPVLAQLATGAVGLALFSLPLPWPGSFLLDIAWWQWAVLVGVGLTGTLGHFSLLYAFARETPAALAPFTYVQIAFAMLGGWLVFSHAPDGWAVVGMLVIAGTGVLSGWLRYRNPLGPR